MTELGPQAMQHLEQIASGPIAGRYELVDRIGEGGMGAVFLARDLALDRDVALKVLRYVDRSPGADVRL